MTELTQSHVADKAPLRSPASGERLSAKQREDVADRLLHDATVSRDYADDIVSCVADMVPNLDCELRYAFVMKLYEFIFRCGHFDGRDALKIFGGTFLTALCLEDRGRFLSALTSGLAPDKVLSCEANAWGFVHIAPVLDAAAACEALASLTGHSVRMTLGRQARDAAARFVLNLESEARAEGARYLAGLVREGAREALPDLIDVLTAIMPGLRDEERVYLADGVAPLIFDTDARIVRKALGYFAAAVRLLPVPHRLPFALMLTGLLQDIALSDDVVVALKSIEPSLSSPEERARIEFALSFTEHHEGEAGGLSDFAVPFMSPD